MSHLTVKHPRKRVMSVENKIRFACFGVLIVLTGPSTGPAVRADMSDTIKPTSIAAATVLTTQPALPMSEDAEQPIVVPNLKHEVAANSDLRLSVPSIGFDEPLILTEIQLEPNGMPVLPEDVKVHLVTNIVPIDCSILGGEYIIGHSTIYTEVWGDAPFNKFKSLTGNSVGQQLSIGIHNYVIEKVIIQPKAELIGTDAFWCTPPGYVSIVACYTQAEDGDNVIVIARPVQRE